jgi:hypothetical protein
MQPIRALDIQRLWDGSIAHRCLAIIGEEFRQRSRFPSGSAGSEAMSTRRSGSGSQPEPSRRPFTTFLVRNCCVKEMAAATVQQSL